MVQILNNKDGAVGKEFWDVHKPIFQSRAAALATFKNAPHRIQNFLEIAQQYSDIGGYLSKDQWFRVAEYIFGNGRRIGTLNFYIDIFKLIFGNNADIEFNISTPSPGMLEITITYAGGGLYKRVVDTREPRVVDSGDERVVSIIDNIITVENIRGLLSKIVPSGIFAKVSIKAVSGVQK